MLNSFCINIVDRRINWLAYYLQASVSADACAHEADLKNKQCLHCTHYLCLWRRHNRHFHKSSSAFIVSSPQNHLNFVVVPVFKKMCLFKEMLLVSAPLLLCLHLFNECSFKISDFVSHFL